MAEEKVTRCDGCGSETRGEVTDWFRLEEHGKSTVQGGGLYWVAETGRTTPPFHFCRLPCLRDWLTHQSGL